MVTDVDMEAEAEAEVEVDERKEDDELAPGTKSASKLQADMFFVLFTEESVPDELRRFLDISAL
jgi:hypothetical protein